MKPKRRKPRTLKIKIFFSMLSIVILQLLVVFMIFAISKTSSQLNENAEQILTSSTQSKKKDIEKRMQSWSDISAYYEALTDVTERMEKERGKKASELFRDSEEREHFLEEVAPYILQMLRTSEATSSFIILEGEASDSMKDAVYLQDLNPQDISEKNKDVFAVAGRASHVLDYGITLDPEWESRLELGEDAMFYKKPFDAGNNYTEIDAMNLAYWSGSLRMKTMGAEMITYTVPLLDSEHCAYGVVGIGITINYLQKYLATDQITLGKTAGYYMGITEDGTNYQTTLATGVYYNARLLSNSRISVERVADREDLYRVSDISNDEESRMVLYELNLYNSNTPFEAEQWVIASLIQKGVLYEASERLEWALAIACMISFCFAAVGAALIVHSMMEPIRTMMANIDSMVPDNVKLGRTEIKEFDELVEKIETLSDKVFKAGSRVADILEFSNIPLGICETEEEKASEAAQLVFCTRKFMEIAELPMEYWNKNYISNEKFRENFLCFTDRLTAEEDEEETYSFTDAFGNRRWVKLKHIFSNGSRLMILSDVTHDMEEKQKIKYDRDYDVLTNLYNRRAFTRIVSDLLQKKTTRSGVLSIWDLDNLKYVNDTYGHDMGDTYICLLAEVMQCYAQPDLYMARMSGDEFMLFIRNDELEKMYAEIEEIHRHFLSKRLLLPDGGTLSVSVSVGMVSATESSEFLQLTRYADFAMYEMKKKEKGGIKRFHKEQYLKDYIFTQGIGELGRILEEKAIQYAYQPIVDVKSHKIFAYEALMRPVSDMLGRPDELLSVAAAQSKLKQVELLTWSLAIGQYYERKNRKEGIKLFINSIPNQWLSESDRKVLVVQYADILPDIVMEITESTQTNAEYEEEKRKFCNEWGIQCALDDYGSGYSNTDMLVTKRFDYVKLDMALIRNIHQDTNKQKLVKGTIEYCHSNHIRVIAEGIETQEEHAKVIELGVDYAQGYYIAKPEFFLREEDVLS